MFQTFNTQKKSYQFELQKVIADPIKKIICMLLMNVTETNLLHNTQKM